MVQIIAANFSHYRTFSAIMSKIIAVNFWEFVCALDNILFWLLLISWICFPKRNILPRASFAKRGRRLLLQYWIGHVSLRTLRTGDPQIIYVFRSCALRRPPGINYFFPTHYAPPLELINFRSTHDFLGSA